MNSAGKDSDGSGSPKRTRLIVGAIATVLVLVVIAVAAVAMWQRRGAEDDATESPSSAGTEDASLSPSPSPEVVTENLFLVEWPEGLCDSLTAQLAPPEQVGPDSTYEHDMDLGGSITPRCTFQAAEAFAAAESGDEFLWFQIDVELTPDPIASPGPDGYQTFTTNPADLGAEEWGDFIKESGRREHTVDCGGGTGCDAAEEVTVEAEYYEFWGAYANLYVEFSVNYYAAADPGALGDRAAAMYGEAFSLLASTLKRAES